MIHLQLLQQNIDWLLNCWDLLIHQKFWQLSTAYLNLTATSESWGSWEHRPRSQGRLDDESSIDDHHQSLEPTVLSACSPRPWATHNDARCSLSNSKHVDMTDTDHVPGCLILQHQIFPQRRLHNLIEWACCVSIPFFFFPLFFPFFCTFVTTASSIFVLLHNAFFFSSFCRTRKNLGNAIQHAISSFAHRQIVHVGGCLNFILLVVETPVWRFWCLASVSFFLDVDSLLSIDLDMKNFWLRDV